MARFSYCNVLSLQEDQPRCWRFHGGSGGQVTLASDRSGKLAGPVPRKWVAKSWTALWQPKLNLAWLPTGEAFLRVLQLPRCDRDEMEAMVEFQLERISPLPLAQMVWSFEVVPSKGTVPSDTQSVLVIIAARDLVEQHLGRLEGDGFLCDRLEVPFLHQLLATNVEGDGLWLYPQTQGANPFCLVAWWYAGALQTVSLIHLTSPERWGAELQEEIGKAAWAGELEGWLTGKPRWHLVADTPAAGAWQPILAPLAEGPVHVVAPRDPADLAALAARRAAREESHANLVPAEFTTRYEQQFVDRLWMRGLGAALVIYLVAVVTYFGWLETLRYQKNDLEKQIAALKPAYDKVQELRARIRVQEEQINLRYAALDALRATAECMPEGLTLDSFHFRQGREIALTGKVPPSQSDRVSDFVDRMNKFTIEGNLVFTNITGMSVRSVTPNESFWSFVAPLRNVTSP
jgi:hypothetical protein